MENILTTSVQPLDTDEINKIEEFRKSKKTAVLSILFTDIVNSTLGTEIAGEEAYSKLRHIHDELFIRIMCRDNAGVIIKEIGDSFLCVFAEPSTAVLRAIEFQCAIHSNKNNLTYKNYSVGVKIGIHVGQVAVEDTLATDIFGSQVNKAARIMSIAKAGQVLTSQAVWENASGWFKHNTNQNISWVYFGKAKFKGFKDKTEVYAFYATETGKPATPTVIKKQKQKNIVLVGALCLLIVTSIILLMVKIKQVNTQNTVVAAAHKSYYVQFNLSNISKQIPDTASLKDNLLDKIITVFYPDSIVTEPDVIEMLQKQGLSYHRQVAINDSFFRNTLNTSGTLFIKIAKDSLLSNDSVSLEIDFNSYPSKSSSNETQTLISLSVKNIETDFNDALQHLLMFLKLSTVQAYVISYNDSTILFRLDKNAKLRKGAFIYLNRKYAQKKGFELWKKDVEEEINFYQNKPQYINQIKDARKRYEYIKETLADTDVNRETDAAELTGKGKVIALYDSTGIAIFKREGVAPWDVPKKGDCIYLTQ